jgi:methionyl-tRNA synthetase
MGKDNVSFHSIIFPGSLIGTGEDYTLVNKLSATDWLNYEIIYDDHVEVGKFSKSRNTGIFGNNCKDTGISSDVFRYYLAISRPETSDSIFSWKELQAKNNNELLANLGNFCNRTLQFISQHLGSKIEKEEDFNEKDLETIKSVNELLNKYIQAMEGIKIRSALKIIMEISSIGNQFLQTNKPWESVKKDKKRCSNVLLICAKLTYLLSSICEPFIPEVSKQILNQLNIKKENNVIYDSLEEYVFENDEISSKVEPLIKKIPDDVIKELNIKFGGEDIKKEVFVSGLYID